MEVDQKLVQKYFPKIAQQFKQSRSSFKDGRKLHFWAHPDLTKSNKARGLLTTTYEGQKFFLDAVM
jgi:hypothetical protein